MKVAITAIVNFSGKDGREWTKVCYLKPNGETGHALLPQGKLDLSNTRPVDLAGFEFEDEIVFGERGFVEEVR